MEKIKVIFLDIDGTIYCNGSPVYCLTELIKMTNAKIVITSSWRIGKTLDQLISDINRLENFPVQSVIGMTEVIYHKEEEIPRGAEIEIYLREHPEIEEYVIIDDEPVPLLTQADHFVQVGKGGFQGEEFREALRILG